MKGLFAVLVFVTASLAAEPDFPGVFGPGTPGTVQTLGRPQVQAVLALAVQQHWNLFDLLDEASPWLANHGRTVRVNGDHLRALTAQFDLGDSRIDTMVPVALVVSLTLGRSAEGKAFAEVVLTKAVSGFLELGDFSLDDHYGFRSIEGKTLGDGYGMHVKNGLFGGPIAQIVRVPDPTGGHDPNFIAIHVSGFFKPKRWQIDPVKALPAAPTTPPPKP
jgi:hypothetical protein